jgi:hypothetical protein
MRCLLALLCGLLLIACGNAAPPGTGVAGRVLLGPSCPLERLNSSCPPRPLAATVVVQDSERNEVARVRSAADGHFTLNLPPGAYTIVGLPITSTGLPRPIATTVVVESGRYASATVTYDSGIR